MMTYLVLKHIEINQANAISGFTWGFPAVSHFLGFVHALSRKVAQKEWQFRFTACAIVCHQNQVHVHRNSPYDPYYFALTRNPLTKEAKTAPIVEEGRSYLKVSLVIECEGRADSINENKRQERLNFIQQSALGLKLAGGSILSIGSCHFANLESSNPTKAHVKLLRPLLPGFLLIDRSNYLGQHNTNNAEQSRLNNWLDFVALQYQATDQGLDGEALEEGSKVKWEYYPKPNQGFLVPIQVGYKKIAPTYQAGEVANTRDNHSPVSFVESIYSVGEWVGSPSRLNSLKEALWQYHYQDPFYLCQSQHQPSETLDPVDVA